MKKVYNIEINIDFKIYINIIKSKFFHVYFIRLIQFNGLYSYIFLNKSHTQKLIKSNWLYFSKDLNFVNHSIHLNCNVIE